MRLSKWNCGVMSNFIKAQPIRKSLIIQSDNSWFRGSCKAKEKLKNTADLQYCLFSSEMNQFCGTILNLVRMLLRLPTLHFLHVGSENIHEFTGSFLYTNSKLVAERLMPYSLWCFWPRALIVPLDLLDPSFHTDKYLHVKILIP